MQTAQSPRRRRLPARFLTSSLRVDPPRFTKVVATIGPASEDLIVELVEAGMSVARLNFSHGSADDHRRRMEKIREASTALPRSLSLTHHPILAQGMPIHGTDSTTSARTATRWRKDRLPCREAG